jgi:threonine synthase
MACCEYDCLECGWLEFGNRPSGGNCPKCGGRMRVTFDEADDYRREAREAAEDERRSAQGE